jgi:hypothetical protein
MSLQMTRVRGGLSGRRVECPTEGLKQARPIPRAEPRRALLGSSAAKAVFLLAFRPDLDADLHQTSRCSFLIREGAIGSDSSLPPSRTP